MHKPTLYLIRGVSGAGKSTFAATLWATGVVNKAFEADDYFYMENGLAKVKLFSVKKYGKEKALSLAIEFRESKILK